MGARVNDDIRAQAVEIYRTQGPTVAARVVGYSKASVCNWARQAGVVTEVPVLTEAATQASLARRALTMSEWRENMQRYLREISEQAAEVELELLKKRGKASPSLEKATMARVRATNDLMLISGEATSRVGLSADRAEHTAEIARLRDELAERRKIKAVS